MGFFTNSAKENEEIRGISDQRIKQISDTQLIMIAIARLSEGIGIDDANLIEELYRRGRS